MIGYSYTEANYTYGIDYVADQLREYLDRTISEMRDDMATSTAHVPALAERLRGYSDACEDILKMLNEPGHQFHRSMTRYIAAARQALPATPRGQELTVADAYRLIIGAPAQWVLVRHYIDGSAILSAFGPFNMKEDADKAAVALAEAGMSDTFTSVALHSMSWTVEAKP